MIIVLALLCQLINIAGLVHIIEIIAADLIKALIPMGSFFMVAPCPHKICIITIDRQRFFLISNWDKTRLSCHAFPSVEIFY